MFYAQDIHENVLNLDIYNKIPAVVYSVLVPTIKKNDVINITSELEVTNEHIYNAMISCNIILANKHIDVYGTLIDQSNAFNITPDMHHGVITKARNWQAESDYKLKYVNVVCWSASVNAVAGDMLKLESGYGHLDVLIN